MLRLRILTIIVFQTILLSFTGVSAITNNTKDKELQNPNAIQGGREQDGKEKGIARTVKDETISGTHLTRSYTRIPIHRTHLHGGHGGYGIGLGTSIHVGGPSHGGSGQGGANFGPGTNYGVPDSYGGSGYGHGGAGGVHISGNGFSFGRPVGTYPEENNPNYPILSPDDNRGSLRPHYPGGDDHRGGYPSIGSGYDGGSYGGNSYPPGGGYDQNGGGLIYTGHSSGHGGSGNGGSGHGGNGNWQSGHGSNDYGPSGHGGGHQISPHKLALKSLLIPLAGVAVIGAAAALASAHPILLQLGVTGKRRRRELKGYSIYPRNPFIQPRHKRH